MSDSDAVRSALASLQQSTNHLNALTDLAAERVNQLEDFLEACGIGFPVSIVVVEPKKPDLWLSYQKLGKRFRIAVEMPEMAVTTWAECSRDIKIRAVTHLPELLAEITEEINAKVVEAEAAAATVENALSALKIPPPNSASAQTLEDLARAEFLLRPDPLGQLGLEHATRAAPLGRSRVLPASSSKRGK